MKKSGFKRPTFEEALKKKKAAQQRARVRLKAKKRQPKKKKPKKRTKLPAIKTMRNKCDKLLTPIIKEQHPICLLQGSENCNYYTQVAHHHVHKSKSNRLRYEIDNLIPLCHACHMMLHANESFWASKIVQIKGIEWFNSLEEKKNEIVKCDIHWYIENYERLRALTVDKTD